MQRNANINYKSFIFDKILNFLFERTFSLKRYEIFVCSCRSKQIKKGKKVIEISDTQGVREIDAKCRS